MISRPDKGKYLPECPFCGRELQRPENRATQFGEVMCTDCACGAICVCDPTGRSIGEAHVEALALMSGSWDIGSLDPDADYRIEEMDYDVHSHSRVYQKGQAVRCGKLVIIKASSGARSAPGARGEVQGEERGDARKGGGMRLKTKIRDLLAVKAFDEIVALSLEDRGVIRVLISLSYDKDDVMTWRAIEAIGRISRAYGKGGRLPAMRETVRKMIWSMTDEAGAVGWSAPEIMGEIIRSDPDEFNDIIPIVWSFREEGLFRENVLWAMGRIAEVRPDLVDFTREELPDMVEDANPVIRGYALKLLGVTGGTLPDEVRQRLLQDESTVRFYEDGEFVTRTIATLAGR